MQSRKLNVLVKHSSLERLARFDLEHIWGSETRQLQRVPLCLALMNWDGNGYMPRSLIDDTPEASAWVERFKATSIPATTFGRVASAVIWTDATRPDGTPVVAVDPASLLQEINDQGMPLLNGHDPGLPIGRVLGAADFTHPDGDRFIAAVLGLYEGTRLSFKALGFDEPYDDGPPTSVPGLPKESWIDIATDPREVDAAWIDDLVSDAPIQTFRRSASYNAAESGLTVILIALPYVLLVWNPFVTAIASEAGKATFAAAREWLRKAFKKLQDRKNPVLELQSHHRECTVSFFFRGGDVKRHYAAHEVLASAAVQAARLVEALQERGLAPSRVAYEFDEEADRWHPSFAQLKDGRLVTDNAKLIAVEQLPKGVSIGFLAAEDARDVPLIKRTDR